MKIVKDQTSLEGYLNALLQQSTVQLIVLYQPETLHGYALARY